MDWHLHWNVDIEGQYVAYANPVQHTQVIDTKNFRDPSLILAYSSAATTIQLSVVPP